MTSRFGELALLVAELSAGDPTFGATRLNKSLFFCDFLHYKRFGAPITGAVYERLPRAPAARGVLAELGALVAGGDATVAEEGYLGHTQRRLVPCRPAQRSVFAESELAMAASVCQALRGHSHANVLGWQLAEEREDIPYPTAFLSSLTPTRAEIARGRALAADLGLAGQGPPGGRRADGPRVLRSVAWGAALPPGYERATEVQAGVAWAVARWPDGVHRIPGSRLHLVKTQWPVPSLGAWVTLEGEGRATVWAVDLINPYEPEEDGSD